MSTDPKAPAWYLESYAADSRSLWRFPLQNFPVRVGRRPGIGLTLLSPLVSQDHAEIYLARGVLQVRDLGSTNGTFVNGERLPGGASAPLREGDVLHFANSEFLLGRLKPDESRAALKTRTALNLQVPKSLVRGARRLDTLLRRRAVALYVQPIVDLVAGGVVGYEVLGRGTLRDLPSRPDELFALAASLGAAAELSRVFRSAGAAKLRDLPGRPLLFFNMHPAELGQPELLASLQALRRELPQERLVLEIHEQAITGPAQIRALRRELADLGIQLAYDDFGAGRGRINELIEVPPDYLKFDESLVRGIERAPEAKRRLLQALIRVCREGAVRTLAEGVETEVEAQTARDLGFELAQGYLYGRPAPLKRNAARTATRGNKVGAGTKKKTKAKTKSRRTPATARTRPRRR